MKRLSGTRVAIADQHAAIDKLEGVPLAPTFIGSAIRHLVPDVFTPGALGWTDHIANYVESGDRTTATIDVPDDVATRQQGKTTDVSGRQVTVDLRGATDFPDARAADDDGRVRS